MFPKASLAETPENWLPSQSLIVEVDMNNKFNFWEELPASYKNIDRVPASYQAVSDRILKALHAHQGMTREILFENCGKRKQDVTNALRHLLRLKIIERSGKGRRGSPYIYRF